MNLKRRGKWGRYVCLGLVAAVLVCSLAGCGGASKGQSDPGPEQKGGEQAEAPTGWVPTSIRIGTAGANACTYRSGGAIAIVLQDALGIPVSAQETSGSAEDCRLVSDKECEAAVPVGPADYFAYTGQGPFKDKPVKDIRAILSFDISPAQVIVLADSPIKSVPDLKGKKIAVGQPGSGQDVMCTAILEEYGMSYKDIEPVRMVGGELLRDGVVDAIVSIIAAPGPWVTELATAKPIRLLPLSEEVRDKMVAKYPFLFKTVMPKGIYAGVKEDVETVGTVTTLIVHEDLDDSMAYKMAKAVFEGKDRIAAVYPAAKETLSHERAFLGMGIPLHPGARKYYEEVGLTNIPKE